MLATEPKVFHVMAGGETHSVEGRLQAVELAKEHSENRHREVVVERDDGNVTMRFRYGSLQSLVVETRRRRRRSKR